MKIEIDLNEILGDDYGPETLAESIRRQVIEKLSSEVKTNIGKKIDTELSLVIKETIKESLVKFMPDTIHELLNAEYVQVDRYGDRSKEPTTFRKQLVQAINEQMVYHKRSYESDNNAFTKAVDSVVGENVNSFKKDFNTLVNTMFTEQCFNYAKLELQKKLGVK